ncbi:Nucleoside-triphosphatase THEP1 [Dethiosulfatibacter aminovorans DSM 17477]|uniref:Nucleoside-triphosphatase THEP1 n=1 Tax=Dethiosulfatibacter aminovorans DSM 17477 TaxID=1121476 RepID=A0A1M6HJ30_9FIRM|nr:nucleoside-triphosphatase [Dethiosulfatibacter aminovorans]SHJ22159.1 Nucleoside-triphosphatase THEP1 [Dethiosulfatibacter aminovorans DSM 17477]
MNNLFISGDIGVGKSYLLKSVLEEVSASMGGFITEKHYVEKGHNIVMKSLNDLSSVETVAYAKETNDIFKARVNVEGFDVFGSRQIEYSIRNRTITVMDELGVMERNSEAFKDSIWSALDSECIVVGIIKNRKNDFLRRIKDREDTKVLFLTGDNGNCIQEEARKWLRDKGIPFKRSSAHVWKQKKIEMYERALEYEGHDYPGTFLKRIIENTEDLDEKTWFEIGSGSGAFSLELAGKSRGIQCVDSSYNMLLKLSCKFIDRGMKNFKASIMPFEDFEDSSCDYALSSFSGSALNKIENMERFLSIAREKAFIICPPLEGHHNFRGDVLEKSLGRKVKSFGKGSGEIMEYLDARKISYEYEEVEYNFPQVFNTIEEAFEFFRRQHNIKENEKAALNEFVRDSLRDEGRIYVFDNFRKAGFFVIDCR